MNWYKKAQINNLSIGEISKQINILSDQYLIFLRKKENLSDIDKRKMEEIGNRLDYMGKIYKQHLNDQKPFAEQLIQKGEGYKVNPHLFMDYHNTGNISEGAYSDYKTVEGLSWLGSPNKYPIFISQKQIKNELVDFRKEDEKLRYTQKDPKDPTGWDHLRDKNNDLIYMTEEQMKEQNLPLTETTIVAFNEKDQPIGFVSNEFGADGVWVVDDYQKQGIGVELLYEFRKQFKHGRKIGQMTGSGREMTRSYHKRLVQEALKKGKKVPMEILQEYELV